MTLQYGPYENKIEYVSFGVDTKIFHPDARSADLRKQLNILSDAPVVLSSRSMEDFYNIDIIIKAIPEVMKDFPKTIFLFAWHSDSKRSSLMELAENLGITSNIRFIGKIDHRDLPKYYAESDIFVSVPTGDTIAISLLEAMASGAAPVVSDLPSPRECIRDGINGYIVPVRDVAATAKSIIHLLRNATLRKSFTEKNREWVVQNADWDRNMKKVEKLYYKLVIEKSQ
jgi:glycosyltransferase involved in cell wall biosynthesis